MNLTKEDLQAISELMDMKLEPINNRLDKIENDIEEIKEDVEIVKGAMEEVLEWFDTYQRNDFDKPFPAKEKEVV